MESKIVLENIEKSYGKEAPVIEGLNLEIGEGSFTVLLGPSGCGKSTLGRVVIHLSDSTGGNIYYKDRDITRVDKKQLRELRKDMQMIFQDPYSSVNPRMTVSQTIAEPLIIAGEMRRGDREKRVDQLMEIVGLAPRLRMSYPHELDGGRRQRVSIARALALNPRFIVCDEPVSALDVSIQAQVLNLMQDLQEQLGLTYMFITHDLSVVKYISNSILVMYLGQTVERCESQRLFENPVHPYTKALLSAVPVPDIHKKTERIILKGELTSPINPRPGCRFASRCIYAREECRQKEPVLEEVEPGHLAACHLLHAGHVTG